MYARWLAAAALAAGLLAIGPTDPTATARPRCARTHHQYCFVFRVSMTISSQGTWSSSDCGPESGNWSETETFATKPTRMLVNRRIGGRFEIEQPRSGLEPFAPAIVTADRQSSSTLGPCTAPAPGEPAQPSDCGQRSVPGVRIAVVAFEGRKRGIRLDVAFGEESPAGNFTRCFQIADGSVGEVISLSGDTATHALAQPTFRPSAFYRHRPLEVKVSRNYSSHSGPQETNPSWSATAVVGWTLDLKPIR